MYRPFQRFGAPAPNTGARSGRTTGKKSNKELRKAIEEAEQKAAEEADPSLKPELSDEMLEIKAQIEAKREQQEALLKKWDEEEKAAGAKVLSYRIWFRRNLGKDAATHKAEPLKVLRQQRPADEAEGEPVEFDDWKKAVSWIKAHGSAPMVYYVKTAATGRVLTKYTHDYRGWHSVKFEQKTNQKFTKKQKDIIS